MQCNLLMCVQVGGLLVAAAPLYGYLRSAGSVGMMVVEELVYLKRIAIYAQVPTAAPFLADDGNGREFAHILFDTEDRTSQHVPSGIPSTVVINHAAATLVEMDIRLQMFAQTHVRYVYDPTLDSIPSNFMSGQKELEVIDLEGFEGVTHVGGSFMRDCKTLTNLDISTLKSVIFIKHGFLSWCSNLRQIDLSPLSNVVTLGAWFLKDCVRLTVIDLSPLQRLAAIGMGFLGGCTGLTSIDLSPLQTAPLTVIEEYFMEGCVGLKGVIDLTPLSSMTKIKGSFLRDCSGLDVIDVTPIQDVDVEKVGFLLGCSRTIIQRGRIACFEE